MQTLVKKQDDPKWVIADVVQESGNTDYVVNGEIYENSPIKIILISDESELELLTNYEPGAIAYTAGFASMWQKAPDGTWQNM